MLEFDPNINDACSTINVSCLYNNNEWEKEEDDVEFPYIDMVPVSFLDFIQEVYDGANQYRRYTGFFVSSNANTQSLCISRLKKCGFKFNKPYKNQINHTTIQLGIANMDVVIAKCKALLEKKVKK